MKNSLMHTMFLKLFLFGFLVSGKECQSVIQGKKCAQTGCCKEWNWKDKPVLHHWRFHSNFCRDKYLKISREIADDILRL